MESQIVKELREEANNLLVRADLIEAGEPLCSCYWSGDPGYECYCTGCGKHMEEVVFEKDIPFRKDAYCYSCRTQKERDYGFQKVHI